LPGSFTYLLTKVIALTERTYQAWFALFFNASFNCEDEQLPGPAKKFEDEELKALLEAGPSRNSTIYSRAANHIQSI